MIATNNILSTSRFTALVGVALALAATARVNGFTVATTKSATRSIIEDRESSTRLDFADDEVPLTTAQLPRLNLEKLGLALPRDQPWTQELPYENQWASTYTGVPEEACSSFDCTDIEGAVPEDLKGSYFKAGPGNMERGGKRYEHVLDGDGFITKLDFDGGKVSYTGRFVETEYFKAEAQKDKILYRNVFGTQRAGGALTNALDVAMKNCANTNVIEWGGRVFALWEGGRPYELDPNTLETLKQASDGPFKDLGHPDAKIRGVTIDKGGKVDTAMKFGKFFTAHPHIIDDGETLVGYRGARNPTNNDLELEFVEYDQDWEEKTSSPVTVPDCISPPHDFSVGKKSYAFFENRLELSNIPFLLGLKPLTDVMKLQLDQPSMLHIVSRGGSGHPIKVALPQGYFNVHNVEEIEEEGDLVTVYSNGWDLTDRRYFPEGHSSVPFLGNWGGEYPTFEEGTGVPPAILFKTVVNTATQQVESHEPVVEEMVVEFPIADERESQNVYCAVSSEDNTSLPQSGIAKVDTKVGSRNTWWAEAGTFTGETVPVAKRDGTDGSWLVTLLYDTTHKRTSVAVLDSEEVSRGPVCRIHLPFTLTTGLHSSFVSR